MMAEALAALRPQPGGRYADGTVGGAGHAAAILAASSPSGWLYGCDRDGVAVEAAERKLAGFCGRFEIRRGNFAELADWVPLGSCDGVLLDLGVSSPQLDEAGRGFSFQQDGPLDMRMDQRQGLTAARLLNEATAEELARIFWELGGERDGRRFARAIVMDREKCRFETTRQLAELIEVGLGHPIGATGAILTVKVLYELARINGRYGLVTMCIGGGQGIAAIYERS